MTTRTPVKYWPSDQSGPGGAEQRFPGVAMGVDEAGNGDPVGGVDDLGAVGRDRRRDRGDLAPLDQDVAAVKVADLRIDRDDRRVLV